MAVYEVYLHVRLHFTYHPLIPALAVYDTDVLYHVGKKLHRFITSHDTRSGVIIASVAENRMSA